jgi:hypothetical protein
LLLSRNSKYIWVQINHQNAKQRLSGSWVSFIIVFAVGNILRRNWYGNTILVYYYFTFSAKQDIISSLMHSLLNKTR